MRRGFLLCTAFVCLAWLATTAVALWHEVPRLLAAADSPAGVFGWFFSMDADWSLPVHVLLALPVIAIVIQLWGSRPASGGRGWTERSGGSTGASSDCLPTPSTRTQFAAAAALFCLSMCCSASIGFRSVSIAAIPGQTEAKSSLRFYELPPAYHDEFSYLLQARTFLAGRLSWPAMTVQPDLFHQVHVLNRPTTAGRYFPWTSVWMAPFVALAPFLPGGTYFGHWLAGAIASVFFHRCLYRMLELRWAFIGGALIALSPGLAAFSNLLLAHHPTMMALSVFLWAFLRLMKNYRVTDAVIAGTALSLAMLGRPMTAAGFAVPFGIWLLAALIRQQCARGKRAKTSTATVPFLSTTWSPIKIVAGIGLPILLGFVALTILNHAITGSWMKSAYQLYTDTWTPRHRYGFDNANIDPALPESKVLKAYDDWAENLTLPKAKSNVVQRTVYSLRWTLGIAALMFCIIAAMATCLDIKDPRPLLLLCSVLTLHAVHIPYWYDGIMHWHYIFETAPLLLMLATPGLSVTSQILRPYIGTRWTTVWLASLIFASLIPNWIDAETYWGTSRVTVAFREQAFSRVRFENFHRLTTSNQIQHPALVLVDEGTSNPQLSYIVNPPDLSGDVIVCRLPEAPAVIDELANSFPGYHLYRFNPETFALTEL